MKTVASLKTSLMHLGCMIEIMNDFILYKPFVCTQINALRYCYPTLLVLFAET